MMKPQEGTWLCLASVKLLGGEGRINEDLTNQDASNKEAEL
jgi:hypothetical protein